MFSYVKEPIRAGDSNIYNISDIARIKFAVPYLILFIKDGEPKELKKLVNIIHSKNEYIIEYYDYNIKKIVKHKMYLHDRKISKIMTFVGTLND